MKRLHAPLLAALLAGLTASAATAGPALPDRAVPPAAGQSAGAFRSGSPHASSDRAVLDGLRHAARPLRTTEPGGNPADLRPLGRMIGDAEVVGFGEATHSTHEFFTVKDRTLRHLVTEKGFRTFALETSWSTGLRLDTYVRTGRGDLAQILREEFQGSYWAWNTAEFAEMYRWIRAWNVRHPHDPVRVMGDDFGHAGPEVFDRVSDYVERHRPGLAGRIEEIYADLRPTGSAAEFMAEVVRRPPAERRADAARAAEAVRLLTERPVTSGRRAGEAYDWAVQHARAVEQTFRIYSFDFEDPSGDGMRASMEYRDATMAANVDWWHRQTGDKMLVSAHNLHLAYVTSEPQNYPRVQGSFLRERLGKDYVSIGTTFGRGSFNAVDPGTGKRQVFTLGARPGSNEEMLNELGGRPFALDLRHTPPAARAWLALPRFTWSIGAAYSTTPGGYEEPDDEIALSRWHDILVHIPEVRAAELLPSAPSVPSAPSAPSVATAPTAPSASSAPSVPAAPSAPSATSEDASG
ncbi:erythromycin esterase family protein [Streptomyces sp. Ru87]|uniref:erythromycin esterase family protein n=1 Tax=Streptomyces sp. Ru87 TaxID=2044307 RepID=UPI000BF4B954|nr:erythromycin esterase family protein [Streptomyces sp. Ru87]PGH50345.1 erythromycin esterase [Streptomyces sp. Ru87]